MCVSKHWGHRIDEQFIFDVLFIVKSIWVREGEEQNLKCREHDPQHGYTNEDITNGHVRQESAGESGCQAESCKHQRGVCGTLRPQSLYDLAEILIYRAHRIIPTNFSNR